MYGNSGAFNALSGTALPPIALHRTYWCRSERRLKLSVVRSASETRPPACGSLTIVSTGDPAGDEFRSAIDDLRRLRMQGVRLLLLIPALRLLDGPTLQSVDGIFDDVLSLEEGSLALVLAAHAARDEDDLTGVETLRFLRGRWGSVADTLVASAVVLSPRDTSVKTVSRVCGMDRWTLRRHLARAGIGPPERVLVGTRFFRTSLYLVRSGRSMRHVAVRLGYSDSRALQRTLVAVSGSSASMFAGNLRALHSPSICPHLLDLAEAYVLRRPP